MPVIQNYLKMLERIGPVFFEKRTRDDETACSMQQCGCQQPSQQRPATQQPTAQPADSQPAAASCLFSAAGLCTPAAACGPSSPLGLYDIRPTAVGGTGSRTTGTLYFGGPAGFPYPGGLFVSLPPAARPAAASSVVSRVCRASDRAIDTTTA